MSRPGFERDEVLDAVYALSESTEPESTGGIINYRVKTIRSGNQIEAECYPIYKRGWKQAKRNALGNLTSDQQAKINQVNARKKFIRLLNCNFLSGGTHTTLTYSADRLPKNMDEAQRDISNFFRRLRRAIKSAADKLIGKALKYIYVIEAQSRDGVITRLHHHIITNVTDRDMLEGIWQRGRANSSRLQPDAYGLSALGNYLTKGVTKSKRRFACSRNLIKPTITVADKKLSKQRAREIGESCEDRAMEIFTKLYPGTEYLDCAVKFSAWIEGAYIYARLRKRE